MRLENIIIGDGVDQERPGWVGAHCKWIHKVANERGLIDCSL